MNFQESLFTYPLAFNDFTSEDAESVRDLFINGQLTRGSNNEYEEALASYFGSKYAVAVNSGSSANLLMITTLYTQMKNLIF